MEKLAIPTLVVFYNLSFIISHLIADSIKKESRLLCFSCLQWVAPASAGFLVRLQLCTGVNTIYSHVTPLTACVDPSKRLPWEKSSITYRRHPPPPPPFWKTGSSFSEHRAFPALLSYVSLFKFHSCRTQGGLGCTTAAPPPLFGHLFLSWWSSVKMRNALHCHTQSSF